MALDFIRKEHYNTEDLIRIVALLRAPGGCPWDQAQTHASIKKNFIEETYEVIEAINRQSTAGLQEELAGEVRDLAGGYLTDLKIEDVTYDLGRIDLGSDVVDMLADNLDPKGTANPRNTLDIYGEIISALPVSLQFSPRFYPTEMEFDIRVEPNVKAKIGETRLHENDLRQIIDGTEIILPVKLEKYFPGSGFTPDQKIVIALRLVKRGGLKLNL